MGFFITFEKFLNQNKQMKKSKILILFGALLLSVSSFSQDNSDIKSKAKLKFLVGGALEFGGESVAEVFFTDGSEQSLNAGQGGTIFAGGELFFNENQNFSLRGTVGFKYLTTKATNYNITLTRFPIEMSANFYTKNNLRFGLGLSSHQGIKFSSDGLAGDENFTGGFGPKFEIAWKWIGISYTIMNYKDSMNNSYGANAFGITLSSSNLF